MSEILKSRIKEHILRIRYSRVIAEEELDSALDEREDQSREVEKSDLALLPANLRCI